MKKNKDLSKYQIHTDLISEDASDRAIGLSQIVNENITVQSHKIDINNDSLTIYFNDITDKDNQKDVTKTFTKELRSFLKKQKIDKESLCLIVGLGNENSTPDSLGPKAASKINATSHLFKISEFEVDSSYRPVSVIIPGIMASTGLNTADYIMSIVKSVKPDFMIIIDALVTKSLSRINKTIQISTTGIIPGSGIYNFQKELSFKTLKIPVIAIGVPTVINIYAIINDVLKSTQASGLDELSKNQASLFLSKTLGENNLMVTTKEIDFLIEKLSEILAEGINNALHEKRLNINN